MTETLHHFIGGRAKPGRGARQGDVYNPSTGKVIAHCPYADLDEIDAAIDVAANAQVPWKLTSLSRRMQVIYSFRQLVLDNVEILAEVIGREQGKTLEDARSEVERAVDAIEFATGAPHHLKGEYALRVGGDVDNFSVRQPLGVVACIAPFNFPAMVPIFMSVMAVACGNSVVLKPSERVPGAANLLAELWQQAGLPDGVWNVLHGDRETVEGIITHPGVAAISFVGSTPAGEHIHRVGSLHGKRVAAFTGGKNIMVVMPDADLDQAATAFVGAAYGSTSQRCMAVSILMPVGDGTAEALLKRLLPKIRELRAGPYNDPGAHFGPLVSAQARQQTCRAIEECLHAGGEMLVDGREVEVLGHEQGFYLGATLIDKVTPQMRLYREEIFGPARAVVRVQTLDEAIRLVNAHEFGNGVALFTRDGYASRQFFEQVQVGMIGINVPIPVPAGFFNFGGLKRSKFGEGHLYGPDAVRFFSQVKTISQRWPAPDEGTQAVVLGFPQHG
ncbi:CoA-acylating methylmalonate-semialdehyde dehydrogenase [Pseudomonas aeruginosa]